MIVLLSACNHMHPSIPKEAGTLSAESLADVYLAASPDTFVGLYALSRNAFGDDDTPCPIVTSDEVGDYLVAQGCTDRWGTTWHGTMNRLDHEGIAEYSDFGPEFDDWRGAAHYLVDGKVEWSYPDTSNTSDVRVDTDVVVTWKDAGEDVLVYVGGTGRHKSAGPLLRERDGDIGVADWGTAEVSHGEIFTAGTKGCNQAIEGLVEVFAANDAEIQLPNGDGCASSPGDEPSPTDCATWAIGQEDGELCIGTRMLIVPTDADAPTD